MTIFFEVFTILKKFCTCVLFDPPPVSVLLTALQYIKHPEHADLSQLKRVRSKGQTNHRNFVPYMVCLVLFLMFLFGMGCGYVFTRNPRKRYNQVPVSYMLCLALFRCGLGFVVAYTRNPRKRYNLGPVFWCCS
jgi:hypothetical protein